MVPHHSVESVFEGNARIASLLDESTHDIEGFDPLVRISWSCAEGRFDCRVNK